jgi:hypothetical protein
MKVKNAVFILLLSSIAFISSCASNSRTYSGLDSSSLLQPSPDKPNTLLYKNMDIDFKKFTKFIVESVEIYNGTDADFNNVSLPDQKNVADFIRDEFTRVIKKNYKIVQQPGPDTLRLKFTLAGLELTRPLLATATHIVPVGLALNLSKSAVGMKGSFTGSVTLAGEFYASENNTLVYAFIAKRGPNAMDVTTILTGLDASKKAITEMAEKFIEYVDKIQNKPGD